MKTAHVTKTAREQLIDVLTPLMPADWRLIKYQRNIDRIDRLTLIVKQQTIEKLPQAPAGALVTSFTLTLVAPYTDPTKAEDALDAGVMDLLLGLGRMNQTSWSTASKVLVEDTYLGYDVSIKISTPVTPDQTESEDA